MYEVIYVSFFMVMLVRRELMSNRVVLYDSTTKLWVNTIKSSALFTIIFPVMNCVIIGIVAAMKMLFLHVTGVRLEVWLRLSYLIMNYMK